MLEIANDALIQSMLLGVLGIVPWIITIAALVDAIRVPNDGQYRAGTKLVWVLVILLLNCIGAIVYYTVGRPSLRT